MTANQISYAALGETKRHNVEQEDISREQNRIAEMRANNEREHNQALEDITRRYNEKSLQISEAQGDEKLRLQAELNQLEREKVEIDNFYKTESIALKQSEVNIENAKQQEMERYQKSLTDLGYGELAAKNLANELQNKKIEYEKYYNDNIIRIQDINALNTGIKISNDYLTNMTRIQHDYELGLINSKQQQEKIDLLNAETAANIKKIGAETENIRQKTILGPVGTMTPFLNLLAK